MEEKKISDVYNLRQLAKAQQEIKNKALQANEKLKEAYLSANDQGKIISFENKDGLFTQDDANKTNDELKRLYLSELYDIKDELKKLEAKLDIKIDKLTDSINMENH